MNMNNILLRVLAVVLSGVSPEPLEEKIVPFEYIELALHEFACRRCIKKALAAADDEEGKMRLQEFFVKHSNSKQITGGLRDA